MELFAAQSVCCAGKRKTGKPKSILWRAWQEEVVEDTTCDNALGKIWDVIDNYHYYEQKMDLLAFYRVLERRPLATATTISKVVH